MRAIIRLTADEVRPGEREVLAGLRVKRGAPVSAPLRAVLDDGRRLFDGLAAPIAVVEEVSRAEFLEIYTGDGRNAEVSPLEEVVRRAERMALFAGTLGPSIDAEIRGGFCDGDAALAYVLDAFASGAANRVAELAARAFLVLAHRETLCALPYSPGYCGWDVTGQRRLFTRLRPEEIGVELNESCMMRPIKSVSGAIVAGAPETHRFDPAYPFCRDCPTRDCRRRMRAVSKTGDTWTS